MPVRLPARVLADLVAGLGLGEPHLAIAPEPVWRDPTTSHQVDQRVEHHLTRLGWRQRPSGVDREVTAALTVLCRPDVGFHGWLTHDHRTTSILAAAIGREAVLAVRTGDTVALRGIHRHRLAERLVAHLPDIAAGTGPPLRVERADLHRTDQSGRQPTDGGVGLRRARPEVRAAKRLISAPTTGAGELYAVDGERPVDYVDTVHGRYLVTATDDLLEIRPATRTALVAELRLRRSPGATVGNSRTPNDHAS
ncbi:ESX secretion-associated protein EspG [Actinophytocola sediminis]